MDNTPYRQIQLSDGRWIEVSEYIFRSWSGPRKLMGGLYHAPVYFLGSNKVAIPFKDSMKDSKG